MATTKINKNASRLIDEAFLKMASPWREICEKLRALVHEADPEMIEDWKWGPNFNHNGMVCNVWGFKNHASLVFFRGTQMKDKYKLFNFGEANKGTRTIKFTDIKQVNDKQVIAYVREAVQLNLSEVPHPKKAEKTVELPPELETFFAKNKKAKAVFDSYNFTTRREIAQSISNAKRPETKLKRMDLIKKRLAG